MVLPKSYNRIPYNKDIVNQREGIATLLGKRKDHSTNTSEPLEPQICSGLSTCTSSP